MKLISLNIEGHKHLDLIVPFLQAKKPDVINLQEVFEVDVPMIAEALGMESLYVAGSFVDATSKHQSHALGSWGIAQFTRLPVVEKASRYYYIHENNSEKLPIFFNEDNPNSIHRSVSWLKVNVGGATGEPEQVMTMAHTHFTWSPMGSFTPLQAETMVAMRQILDELGEFVLTGDFNSPRNGEPHNLFNTLAETYRDNIPPEIMTSIDGQFHKAGPLELMVDGCFSTPEYQVTNVRLVDGVSDHLAVVAEVGRMII